MHQSVELAAPFILNELQHDKKVTVHPEPVEGF
jgi:hypothetical protein